MVLADGKVFLELQPMAWAQAVQKIRRCDVACHRSSTTRMVGGERLSLCNRVIRAGRVEIVRGQPIKGEGLLDIVFDPRTEFRVFFLPAQQPGSEIAASFSGVAPVKVRVGEQISRGVPRSNSCLWFGHTAQR